MSSAPGWDLTGAGDPAGLAGSDGTRTGVCMYSPSSCGIGHWQYTYLLLEALARLPEARGLRLSMVTSDQLDPRYRSGRYPIHAIFPSIRPRESFSSRIHWACSRLVYYLRREHAFLRWALADTSHQIVHVQDYWTWLAWSHLPRLARSGKEIFATVHNITPHVHRGAPVEALRTRLERRAWRACTGLFVHTPGLADRLSERLGPGHPPIRVTPMGAWTTEVADSPSRRPTGGGGGRRLLCFGAMRPNKGITVLVEAMRLLPECALTLAGAVVDDRYFARVQRAVQLAPEARINLISSFIPEEEVLRLFGEADLLVFPYTSFGAQSGVLHMALAHGVPVVVTDVGALGETVRNLGIGEVVAPGDPAALAAGIRRMLDGPRRTEVRAAMDAVRDQVSWEEAARETATAYLASEVARPR